MSTKCSGELKKTNEFKKIFNILICVCVCVCVSVCVWGGGGGGGWEGLGVTNEILQWYTEIEP